MVHMVSSTPGTASALPVLAVVGPTGTGKSALAIALARHLDGECVNADSMQFYRGMDIGTAKVSIEQMQGVPHHLLDILDVTEEASVAQFQAQARAVIDAIRARGKYPILVGGSGLYVRTALDKLELPGTDPAVRARLERQARCEGIGVLQARLAQVDALSGAQLKDERRIIRALEVFEVTGRPFSAFMPSRQYVTETLQIGLNMNRAGLHERLHQRVIGMEEAGLLGEVERLAAHGLRRGKTASRAIGYAQFLRVLDARTNLPDASPPTGQKPYTVAQAVEDTTVATRQFARRQLTWFRADERVHWLDAEDPHLLERSLTLIRGR